MSKAKMDIEANRQWLAKHKNEYIGEWVAIRNGLLLAHAKTLKEIDETLGDAKSDDVMYTRTQWDARIQWPLEVEAWRVKTCQLERERDAYDILTREIHQAISDVIVSAAPVMPDSPFAPLLALNDKLYEIVVNKKWPTT